MQNMALLQGAGGSTSMGYFVFPNFSELAAFRKTKIPKQEPVSETSLGWCISVQAVWVFSHQHVGWRLNIKKCGGAGSSQAEFLLASGGLSMSFVACGVGYV